MSVSMCVNKRLLIIKAHYFLYNAGIAPIIPFVSVYARQLGFSSVIVGLIYTIMPIAGLIIKPTMGALADKFKCQKLIFSIAQILIAVAYLSIYFVPSLPLNNRARFSCNNGVAAFYTHLPSSVRTQLNGSVQCELNCPITIEHWTTICNKGNSTKICENYSDILQLKAYIEISENDTAKCINYEIDELIHEDAQKFLCNNVKTEITSFCDVNNCNSSDMNAVFKSNSFDDGDVVKYYQFSIFISLMIIAAISHGIIETVGNTICFALLENKPHKYGQQRAFGALGWGLFSLIAGFMIDKFSKNGQRDFASTFYLGFSILLIDFIVSRHFKFIQESSSKTIFKDVGKLFLNIRILIFFGWCVIVGMCTSLVWHFLLWLIEDIADTYDSDNKSWISSLQGSVNMIQCLGGELPLFFLSGWIIKKLGHVNTMTLILAVIGLRFVLYSFVVNPWLILPIEVLNGLTFGLAYATMTSYAHIISPSGTATTIQGLTSAVFGGIGVSLGSFVGGIIYKYHGGAMTFRIFGIGSFIACIIHAVAQYLLQREDSISIAVYATPSEAKNIVHEESELKNMNVT